jgi:hypothetical protein
LYAPSQATFDAAKRTESPLIAKMPVSEPVPTPVNTLSRAILK